MNKQPGLKIDRSPYLEDIREVYNQYRGDLAAGALSVKQLFAQKVLFVIPGDTDIKLSDFYNWVKKEQAKAEPIRLAGNILEREKEKQIMQAEIRQDVTHIMHSFIGAVKALSQDPEALKNSGVKITDLYKIIREEEDRNKVISLKERAENRADAQFAFFVSIARAGQLTETDIEFLNDDLKKELALLKNNNGIYQLPGQPAGGLEVEAIPAPAEIPAAGPD